MSTTTDYFDLVLLPPLSEESRDVWAQAINDNFEKLANALGPNFTQERVNVTDDLSFNENSAVELRTTRFAAVTEDVTTPYSVWFKDDDFYITDGQARVVRISANALLNTGSGIDPNSTTALKAATNVWTGGQNTFTQRVEVSGILGVQGNSVFRNNLAVSGTISGPTISGILQSILNFSASVTSSLQSDPGTVKGMQIDAGGTATMVDLTGLEQGENIRFETIQIDSQTGSNLTLHLSSSTNVLRKTGTSTIDRISPASGSINGKFFFIKHTSGGGGTTTINHNAGTDGILCPGSMPFVIGAGAGGLEVYQALFIWNNDAKMWSLFPRGHGRSENITWDGIHTFDIDTFFVGTQHNSGSVRNGETVTNLSDTFTAGTLHNSGTFRGVKAEYSQNVGIAGSTNVQRLFVSGTQTSGADSFQTGTQHNSGSVRNGATVTNLSDTFTAGTLHNSGTLRGIKAEFSQNVGVQGSINLQRVFVSGTQVNGADSFQTGTAHMSGAVQHGATVTNLSDTFTNGTAHFSGSLIISNQYTALTSSTYQTNNVTGSHTFNPKWQWCIVEMLGAGGAGGGSTAGTSSQRAAGGGGGAGHYRKVAFTRAASGLTTGSTYIVGKGGAQVLGGNGGDGSNSGFWIGSTLYIGAGGNGGLVGGAGTTSFALGGTPNNDTAKLFDVVNTRGGAGCNGFGFFISGSGLNYGGNGGVSCFGSSGRGASGNGNGGSATGHGGGGGGGAGSTSDQQGGGGADGIVIVWEFA